MRAGVTTVQLSLSDLRGSLGELKFFCDVLTARDMQLYAEGGPPLNADVPLCSLLSYFEFNVAGYFCFVVFKAAISDSSTERDGIRLDCGTRILLDCHIGDSVDKVKQAGTRSYELEASRYGDECLGLGDLRALLGI